MSLNAGRLMVWNGVIGPVGFVAAWVVAGSRAKGYSPVHDAISQLAATDASTRWLMTAGFVCFGIAVPLFSLVLRRAVPGPAWIAAAVSGFATLGVAVFPLHVSSPIAALHGACASVGYVALALVPFLAGRVFAREGHRAAATASMALAATSAMCLAATPVADANGLFQRLGLGVVDVWLVVSAIAISKLRRQTPRPVVTQRKNDGRTAR
jgi:hypothetical membrane protein